MDSNFKLKGIRANLLKRVNTLGDWVNAEQDTSNLKKLKFWGKQVKNKKTNRGYVLAVSGENGYYRQHFAVLIAQFLKAPLYRINASELVSKYIGETEKNLEKLFAQAAENNWILFFDEADSLFGKRTEITDAGDKYANQEVSYLLQRLETSGLLVIISSNNFKNWPLILQKRTNWHLNLKD